LVATHLLGIPADLPALRAALPDRVRIVEDCAQAWGARLDGRPVGTLGDAAAFSLGPDKIVDAGEGGLAVLATEAGWDRAVAATQHALRIAHTNRCAVPRRLPSRIHPAAALLALASEPSAHGRIARAALAVAAFQESHPGLSLPGADARRQPSWWRVPLPVDQLALWPTAGKSPLGTDWPDDLDPASAPHAAYAATTWVAMRPDRLAQTALTHGNPPHPTRRP
jgi:dTDP-4-amino-4,6-dideoxygalactose transaminase